MSRCEGSERIVSHSSAVAARRSPLATPGARRASGTNRKNGIMKTRYQTAENGPTRRSPSRVAASSVEQGIEPEQRLAGRRIGDDEPGHEREADEAARVADRPAGAREPAELARAARGSA